MAHNGLAAMSRAGLKIAYVSHNKTLNKMKNIINLLNPALLIGAVMCCFSSCENSQRQKPHIDVSKNIQTTSFNDYRFTIVVIDSCEYILYREQFNDGHGDKYTASITHKSNCKYCAERAKRSLK